MARPKLKIDEKQVEGLAGINCTVEEIASVLGCSKDTLERRFAAAIKRGRHNGKSSLRRMMWEKAKEGNITMMIWLSKQLLGYTDKVENKDTINASVSTEKTLIILPDNGRQSKNE
jgi:predicted transcriptional regulator